MLLLTKFCVESNIGTRTTDAKTPDNYKLSTLYKFITGLEIENTHMANANVNTTIKIFQAYFKDRQCFVKKIGYLSQKNQRDQRQMYLGLDDSDEDSMNSESDDEEYI